MNCDCIKRVESEIAEHMRPKAGDDAVAKVENMAIFLTHDTMDLRSALQIGFRVKGSKKGYTSERGTFVGCNVTFCPFCGKPAGKAGEAMRADEEAKARDRVRDAVAGALDGLYTCGRVWNAWNVGTMSQDDFAPAAEDDDVVGNVTDAAIAAMKGGA